jgi:hypothetical protein
VPSQKLPVPDELDLNAQFTAVSQLAGQQLASPAEAIDELSGLRLAAGRPRGVVDHVFRSHERDATGTGDRLGHSSGLQWPRCTGRSASKWPVWRPGSSIFLPVRFSTLLGSESPPVRSPRGNCARQLEVWRISHALRRAEELPSDVAAAIEGEE